VTWPGSGGEVELLRSMVLTPSFSGEEGAVVDLLVERMTDLGFVTHVDAVGNVHGAVGDPDDPELLLLGHVDTVPDSLPVRLYDDVLTGRGTVDAKGPLAAMICAAARLADRVAARIVVTGAVGEEATSDGATHLLNRPAPAAVIIGEPSGVDSIGIGYKGIFRFVVDLTRPAVHTSSAQATAAECAVDLWNRLRARFDAEHPADAPRFERALPSITRMTAELHRARMDVSCRTPPGFDAIALSRWLRALGDHRITVVEDVPAVRTARSDPVVRALSAAVRRHGGRPVPKLKLGTSDWNVVGPHWPVPIAAYGPGNSRLCHTADEHIRIPEYLKAIDVLTSALPRLADSLSRGATTASAAAEREETEGAAS
jgi:[amino group carrier protein]-lysine/ornithine hydrolase